MSIPHSRRVQDSPTAGRICVRGRFSLKGGCNQATRNAVTRPLGQVAEIIRGDLYRDVQVLEFRMSCMVTRFVIIGLFQQNCEVKVK